MKVAAVLKSQAISRVSTSCTIFSFVNAFRPLKFSAHSTLPAKEQSATPYSESFTNHRWCTEFKKFPKAFAYFPQVDLLSRLVSLTVKVLLTQQRRSHVRTEAVVALAPNWPLKEALGPRGVAHDHLK